MEEFKKKIINKRRSYLILTIMTIIFFILVIIDNDTNSYYLNYKFLKVTRTSFLAILFGVFIANFIRLGKWLKDDEVLKKIYIKESDERTRDIIVKSSSATFKIMIFISSIAIFVPGYFSSIAYYTILIATLANYIIYGLSYIYYNKKY